MDKNIFYFSNIISDNMDNDYHINLQEFSLNTFKNELSQADLIPSRQILQEQMGERFKILEKNGVQNLQDLSNFLKTPKKAKEFAKKSGLPQDYVLILRREVNSYQPQPVNLDKFPGIKGSTINKLNEAGIKNTAHFFTRVKTAAARNELATETGIDEKEILELTKLTDLSRVKWIGPIFARIFLDAGVDNVEKLSSSSAKDIYPKLVAINGIKAYTRAKFLETDVRLCINVSRMVPQVIKY
jgi:hypothetical protein